MGNSGVLIEGREGLTNISTYGRTMTLIKYNNYHNIIVKFDNGWETKSEFKEFKNGNIVNPYDKLLYGIGYLGEGKYKSRDNSGRKVIQYHKWNSMLSRCYNEKEWIKHPTYVDCSVCNEWYNYQNFAL